MLVGRDHCRKAFAPVEQRALLEVRYRHRHHAGQNGDKPEGERTDEATADLLATVNGELAKRAWNDTDADGETDRCPTGTEEDGEWPWHGAGHYTFEFAWSFPVHSADKCLAATVVNFLGSYRTDQSTCCAVWIYGPGYDKIATFDLVTERRVVSVQAGKRRDADPAAD